MQYEIPTYVVKQIRIRTVGDVYWRRETNKWGKSEKGEIGFGFVFGSDSIRRTLNSNPFTHLIGVSDNSRAN